MNTHYPEMDGPTPETEIVASAAYGSKFYIKTTLELSGHGIWAEGATDGGKNTYVVLASTLKRLDAEYDVVLELVV